MRKFVSIVATAVVAGSMATVGAMSASAHDIFYTEGQPATTNHCTEMAQFETETVSIDAVQFKADEVQVPTETPTEVPTESVVTTEAIAVDVPTTTVAVEENKPAQALPSSVADAKVFDALTKSGENWEDFEVIDSKYDNANDVWTVTVRRKNGNDIRVFQTTADGAVRIDQAAATTAAVSTTAQSKATTTAAATKAANKNGSPKTGVAIPAIPVAGLAIAAVAVAFTLKKKSN